MQPVRGILLDIDGVLHVGMQPIAGAKEALEWLAQHEYRVCLVTNTTTMSRALLAQRLQEIGLPVEEKQIVTAPVATANYVRQHFAGKRCWILTKGDTGTDFAGIELVDGQKEAADVVVIGGAEELLTYQVMNQAFRLVIDGAPLLAMHTNRYWRTKDGLQLDSGPFVRALEIATEKQAVVLGKPSRDFFTQALATLGVEAGEAIMVGDDIENDIDGAQRTGIRGILVLTGKHGAESPLLERIQPTAILDLLAHLPSWLEAAQ